MTRGKNVLGGIVIGGRMTGENRDRGEECPGGRMSGIRKQHVCAYLQLFSR